MEIFNRHEKTDSKRNSGRAARLLRGTTYYVAITLCILSIFHSSLLVTSQPLHADDLATVDRAVELLDAKGFRREAFLLRHLTVYRNTDNWLNAVTEKENAYAATNYPFNVVTLYPDFFTKAADDTERAMILLHEVQHIQGGDERAAYEYAWRNRGRIGWTMLSHGTTESYITVEVLTRETVPELFTCADRLWNDCTEAPNPSSAARQ